ncbi:MAG: flavodoxin domain-containing protein [Actinomycetaceae bacterium]|nr:flavodoxin domain-containing protein [Actinomycetaceae bacterium]
MKILLVWASRHGSTKEVAYEIFEQMRDEGVDVEIREASEVSDLSEYGGVVLGSCVYMTQWDESMRRFMKDHQSELFDRELWTFSVGLSTVQTGLIKDPARVGATQIGVQPRMNKLFSGHLDPSKLSLRERTIARLGGASEGDFRDWEEIRAWGREVASDAKSLN